MRVMNSPRLSPLLCCVLAASGCAAEPSLSRLESPADRSENIILLHGMARSPFSMKKMAKFLKRQGYGVLNFGYSSRSKTVEAIAEAEIPVAVARCRKAGAKRIHFVTHSLGGIVLRQYLQTEASPEIGRVVMLSPPNHGSELADALKHLWLYRWVNGPAGQQVGTERGSLPNRLAPVKAEVGVITGSRSLNPFYSSLIPGPDDGKVSVESAKLDEMRDFRAIPASHTFIMNDERVLAQTAYFLKHGKFAVE